MATFKVGQRVRIVFSRREMEGCEATVISELGIQPLSDRQLRHRVEVDGHPCPSGPGTWWGFLPENLAPLTPPAADSWALGAVRKVTKPQHTEPVVQKERA